MKTTFRIPMTPALRSIIQHSLEHDLVGAYGQPPHDPNAQAALFFVKDHGAYLMPATAEKLAEPGADANKWQVVYLSDDVNPDVSDDCWLACRDVFGGDDFAMDLPIPDEAIVAFKSGRVTAMVIEVRNCGNFQYWFETLSETEE